MGLVATNLGNRFDRSGATAPVLIVLALATGGLFKVSAFAREAFIASKFGLTAVTDAYFALQQFPVTFATFMFGAFALAFTPAYADARQRSGSVSWLHGLVFYGCLLGAVLTAIMLGASPFLLSIFSRGASHDTFSTLLILSFSFAPIACIGIWAGICTARGNNLWAMSMTGLPYLVMTLVLFFLYGIGRLNNLSLPISMAAGFGIVGIYSLVRILCSQPVPSGMATIISTWKTSEFRAFLRQLGASSIENGGFACNQLLLVYYLAQAGTGIVSANTCGMRIGLLGYSLLAQPLALLVQARLCSVEQAERDRVFRRWMLIVASGVLLLAALLYVYRLPVIRMVYMHGKFQANEAGKVSLMLPAWIGYFVVMSLNAVIARYMFTEGKGSTYVCRQLAAYGVANLFRFVFAARVSPAAIIWCSVLSEFCAFAVSLWSCLQPSARRQMSPAVTRAEEAF